MASKAALEAAERRLAASERRHTVEIQRLERQIDSMQSEVNDTPPLQTTCPQQLYRRSSPQVTWTLKDPTRTYLSVLQAEDVLETQRLRHAENLNTVENKWAEKSRGTRQKLEGALDAREV